MHKCLTYYYFEKLVLKRRRWPVVKNMRWHYWHAVDAILACAVPHRAFGAFFGGARKPLCWVVGSHIGLDA